LTVEVVAHADSTNTRLLERARVTAGNVMRRSAAQATCRGPALPAAAARLWGAARPTCSRACWSPSTRDRGRGRLGRDWVSSPGASLTFSLALALQPIDWSGLSLAVGLALAETLDPLTAGVPPRIVLKWPNDLWLVDSARGRRPRAQAGWGADRNRQRRPASHVCRRRGAQRVAAARGRDGPPRCPQRPPLTHGYGCLSEIEPTIDAPSTLSRAAGPLVRALLSFQATGFSPLAAAYARRDILLGQPVSTTLPEVPDGVADGVDERGALRVRRGAVHHLVSGEVSVRLQPGSGEHEARWLPALYGGPG
jgi:BirA family biotin operon repressor/biotin-[acetyl-CoA-carboxylase] ligase